MGFVARARDSAYVSPVADSPSNEGIVAIVVVVRKMNVTILFFES